MIDGARLGSQADESNRPLAELRGITKKFGALVANDAIDFTVMPGEVHALLGENGAGKSTLTRILFGLSRPDEGTIAVDGRQVSFASPGDARRAGVGMVTQEFSLVETMTVAQNILLASAGFGPTNIGRARAAVEHAADSIGVTIDPDAVVSSLSVGQKQRVEIAKALYYDCKLLILDEPTAVLVPQDVAALFASIRKLSERGIGVIFISHKLHEVVEIADRISVLRHGRIVDTVPAAGLDQEQIVRLMIGSDLVVTPSTAAIRTHPSSGTQNVLQIENLRKCAPGKNDGRKDVISDLSISVRQGEIVGVAGVSGNGQTELVRLLCGTEHPDAGSIRVNGIDVTGLGPQGRLAAGLGRLTEDRRGSVIPNLSVEENLAVEDLGRYSRHGLLRRKEIRQSAERLIADFGIKAKPTDLIRSLSGGNMQKVLLARTIARKPSALVVSQPTRGLDVGACEYVYSQLEQLKADGCGILLISEDLDELLRLSDRILVLYEGGINGELDRRAATPDALGLLMSARSAAVKL